MKEKEYERVKEDLAEFNPDMIFYDGLEDGLIGVVRIFNHTVALYDYEKCVNALIERGGSTYEEVVDHLEFNSLGTYVGENTPGFFVQPESLQPPYKDEDAFFELEGQGLLDALTTAYKDGNYKGWSFAESVRSTSVLPAAVRDNDNRIVKHLGIESFGGCGEIQEITLAITTEEGTKRQDFVLKKPELRVVKTALELLKEMTDEERLDLFHEFCVHCGGTSKPCTCWRDD